MNFDKGCRVVQTALQIIKSEFIISTTAGKQEFFYSVTNVAKLQLFIIITVIYNNNNFARQRSTSCHTSAWLQVFPAPGLNLHLDLSEF